MILLLDTSTPTCKLRLVDDAIDSSHEWEAGRGLADGLLEYVRDRLAEQGSNWSDIAAIGVFKGPGSFTGLRIGLTVVNTVAQDRSIPIIGAEGGDWQQVALNRLRAGENDHIVMPHYGREANITKPRK